MVSAVLLLGCGDGPLDLTRVDDLRLVTAIAEPAEVAVGETFVLTAVVADPFGEGADVWLWQCGPPELPCQIVSGALDDDTATGTFLGGLPLPMWIVACRPGVCAPPTEAELRDPVSWLQQLPLAGVAAGTKTVGVADGEDRRNNPELTTAPEPSFDARPDDAVPLRFVGEGIATVSGLATAGGFSQLSEAVPRSGDFTIDWLTPADAGPVRLWVVVDDALGGSAVWRGTATVR